MYSLLTGLSGTQGLSERYGVIAGYPIAPTGVKP